MKFKLVFLCMFCFGIGHFVKTRGVPEFTTPEDLSFHAVVESTVRCSAVLIRENYVVVPASCVNGSSSVKVFPNILGIPEPNAEFLISTNIFIHDEFAKTEGISYFNDITLVKFPRRNSTVKPGKLITRNQVQLKDESFVNVSGYIENPEGKNINYFTAQVENEDTCNDLLENQLLRNQEICLKDFTFHRTRSGNIVTLNDKIIGFLTRSSYCIVKTLQCDYIWLALIFRPFLQWMSDKMNIPIEQFTSSDNSYLKTTEDLEKRLNGLETKFNNPCLRE